MFFNEKQRGAKIFGAPSKIAFPNEMAGDAPAWQHFFIDFYFIAISMEPMNLFICCPFSSPPFTLDNSPIGLVVRVFAIGAGGREFDPDRVKPKTLKMEPMTPSLSLSTMGRNREVLCGRLISCSEGSYTPKTASYHRNQS